MENEEDLESLGEKLYTLIDPKHPDMAPKLTGMLLELPRAVIGQMLQDEELLTQALERALAALQPDNSSEPPPHADDVDSESSDSLGEQLYELINLYNTGYTQKITGMLLEQEKNLVLQLLSDPVLLEEKVNMALKTLQDSSCRSSRDETCASDSSDQDEVEVIGEKLFALVRDIEPAHCADITEAGHIITPTYGGKYYSGQTEFNQADDYLMRILAGMLLEMDLGTLRQILSDRNMLEVAVLRAKSARENAPSQPQPDTN